MAATAGVRLIAIERTRQIEVEGWAPEHDDAHGAGEMLDAARCYELAAAFQLAPPSITGARFVERPAVWPWEESSWKPAPEPVRNLVKAGALIAAEIDRLLRADAAEFRSTLVDHQHADGDACDADDCLQAWEMCPDG